MQLNMVILDYTSGRTQSNVKNDYLNDRLSAQRLLSFISLIIPLTLFILYLALPHASDAGHTNIVINVSAAVVAIAAFRFFYNWKKPRDNAYQISCIVLDFLSAAAILVAYALSYEVPLSIALKSPTANIFFIYLTARVVLFHGKIVLQTGVIASTMWITLVGLAVLDSQYVGRTSSYIEYLTSFKVLIGAEIERLIQFASITAILYTFINIARHDAPTGFLRRPYFLQSTLKFFTQAKHKYSGKTHALIEFRATDITSTERACDQLFKCIPDTPSFKHIRFKRMGRLSYQSAAARIEFKGSNDDLLKLVKNMHKEISQSALEKMGTKMPLFVIGVTILDANLKHHDQLSYPDLAINEALKEGKKVCVFNNDFRAKLELRHKIEQSIKDGLEKRLFSVSYQPIIDLMTGKPVGLEALARLKDQAGDPISPDLFISIAESSGLINDITDYMCDCIARDAAEIKDMFTGQRVQPYININISPIQLKNIERVTAALKRAESGRLKINAEITESSILNEQNTDRNIQILKEAGFAVAIDDFGTGYSSIQRLNKLDSMALKVDQSFVRNIGLSKEFQFLEAIVRLAQTTSNLVIVEGVETLQQKLLLMQMGVRYVQGYFYSKPMDVYELESHLSQRYEINRPRQSRAGHIASFI